MDFETIFTAALWQWEARTDRWTFVSLTAVLPVKASVRRAEGVESGDEVIVELRLR